MQADSLPAEPQGKPKLNRKKKFETTFHKYSRIHITGDIKGRAEKTLDQFLTEKTHVFGASQVVLLVNDLPAKAGDVRDLGSIPGSRRFPGGGHSKPLQDSCLENPTDRGAESDTTEVT